MPRGGWWLLAVLGGLAFLKLFVDAMAGDFTTTSQVDFFRNLGLWGFLAFILIEGFSRYRREFQSRNDWTRFASLQPLLTIVAIVGGVWLWWSYFGRHHATVIWFTVVLAVIGGLKFFRTKAEKQWKQERQEEATK